MGSEVADEIEVGAKRVSASMRQVLPQTGNTLPRSIR